MTLSASALLLTAATTIVSPVTEAAPPDPDHCDGRPVMMIVEGDVKDAERLDIYAAAIRRSGLYPKLGGYYVISPRPLAVFEGSPPASRSMLVVRFPCFAHARAFWNSKLYRETIMPLRSNPSAGDFTVTVHLELDLPDYMTGRVSSDAYGADPGSTEGIEQIGDGRR